MNLRELASWQRMPAGGCLAKCPTAILPRLDEVPWHRPVPLRSTWQDSHVLNSVEAGRRLILRAALYPLAAVVVLALAFLLVGSRYALGALVSGLAVVAGGTLAAWVALGGGVQAAGSALARMVMAFVLKTVLVIGVLVAAFAWWRLPPLALLAGIPVALMFQVLALARR